MTPYLEDIQQRNQQYGRMMMSKNPESYEIFTRSGDEVPVKRMEALSPDYLDSVGRRWVSGKFCDSFVVRRK